MPGLCMNEIDERSVELSEQRIGFFVCARPLRRRQGISPIRLRQFLGERNEVGDDGFRIRKYILRKLVGRADQLRQVLDVRMPGIRKPNQRLTVLRRN